jgi:hypothetical protein
MLEWLTGLNLRNKPAEPTSKPVSKPVKFFAVSSNADWKADRQDNVVSQFRIGIGSWEAETRFVC